MAFSCTARRLLPRGRKSLEFFGTHSAGTMSDIRQFLGVTRKYAVPLLVYFDGTGLTERDFDLRRLAQAQQR